VEAVLWLSDHYVEAVGSNVPHSMMVSHFKLSLREWAGYGEHIVNSIAATAGFVGPG
jgi:hypothetical protein